MKTVFSFLITMMILQGASAQMSLSNMGQVNFAKTDEKSGDVSECPVIRQAFATAKVWVTHWEQDGSNWSGKSEIACQAASVPVNVYDGTSPCFTKFDPAASCTGTIEGQPTPVSIVGALFLSKRAADGPVNKGFMAGFSAGTERQQSNFASAWTKDLGLKDLALQVQSPYQMRPPDVKSYDEVVVELEFEDPNASAK